MTKLTNEDQKIMDNGYCPTCNSEYFKHGPCGGCSENIKCVNCGKEYCISFGFDTLQLNRNQPELYRDVFRLKK